MKLGPVEIKLQRNVKRPPLSEMGVTGTQIFGGLLAQQDYNAALTTPTLYDEYDKMRNDGQVKAALTVIKLPLLNATWGVESASDKPMDREIAERVEQNLLHEMTISWPDYLRQVLLMLDYGSMPFEKVWAIEGGMVRLRKLAPRLPRTVVYWMTDSTGGLAGIQQMAIGGPKGFQIVDIPVEKLLVFINDLEGSNFRGTSILRSAYKHHYYKDNLYRVQAIALEKRSLGVDVGTLKGEARTDEHKKDLERALMSLHAHEKQYMVEIDEQVGYRLEGIGQGGVLDPLAAIEHHDLRIVRSMIAEFVAMGAGSTGSLAMHRDKTSYLLLALGGIANYICETHNRHLIPQWVDYNWVVDEYPRLRYSRLEQRDVAVFADAVQKLTASGALTADPTLEEESRTLLSLPQPEEIPEPEEVPEEEPLEEMPTEEALAAIRTLRRLLKRRREVEEG